MRIQDVYKIINRLSYPDYKLWLSRLFGTHWLSGLLAGSLLIVSGVCADDTWKQELTVATDKSYEDIMIDLDFAITQLNFRITDVNDIGEAIASRNNIEFPRHSVIQFCNLELARQFLEIDSSYLIYMPCRIAVYESNGRMHIKTYLLPENDTEVGSLGKQINTRLREILNIAAK